MFSLIPSDANDPQGLMRRKEPNKQTIHFHSGFGVFQDRNIWTALMTAVSAAS